MALCGDYQLAPSPNRTIGCQHLLKDGACIHSGWLRRQSTRNRLKIFAWPQVYVVMSGGCVYCYSSEVGRKPASAFSLYGYDKILRAGEVTEKEATWTFKLVHVSPGYRTYFFSASSEKEMAAWMTLFKQEMLRANGKLPRTQGDGNSFNVGVYQEAGSEYCGSVSSQDYMDIETSIYEDSSQCVLPSNYTNKKEEDDSDDEMDRVVTTRPDLQQRPPQPPPVPRRPPKALPGMKQNAVDSVTEELKNLTTGSKPQPKPGRKTSVETNNKEDEKPAESQQKNLRTRGSPDGSSLKREEKRSETEEFWSSIYFYGKKEQAAEIIRQMPYEGVYLVRVNDDRSMVLHVYANEVARKFQIFKVGEQVTLKKDSEDYFNLVEEMICHYYAQPLPNLDVCLSECYIHHPKYRDLHFS